MATEREKALAKQLDLRRLNFYSTLREIRQRLENEIMATPTGELRNLLCDASIVIGNIVDGKLLAKPE